MNTYINKTEFNSNREQVHGSYKAAVSLHNKLVGRGELNISSKYTYQNQIEDALTITNIFYRTLNDNPVRAISIIKRTKVGCNGLMIEIAKNMSTHIDDNIIIMCENIFFITGMSNRLWEKEFIEQLPSCFNKNVYHHGKIKNIKNKFKDLRNALIIIDEIDTGDKEGQRLHKTLDNFGLLDIKYMEKNNIRFIFVSATIKNQLHELYKWGDKHKSYTMTVPKNYISHVDFLEKGIIQEFYSIKDKESAEKWINEDILEKYKNNFRVHIIRTDIKNICYIKQACDNKNINFSNHTSDNRISEKGLQELFDKKLTNHVVIAVKGFYRRANLIPNKWKIKIGAIHERYCNKVDTSVQVQGLVGRMTGYWKNIIFEQEHKTGPYRTSIKAIEQYEKFYSDPKNNQKYNTNGSKKTFVHPKNISNLNEVEYVDENKNEDICKTIPILIDITSEEYNTVIKKINNKYNTEKIINIISKYDINLEP